MSYLDLPAKEAVALAAIELACELGQPCPTCDDLREIIGCPAVSTTVAVVKRLEAKGIIKVDRYQRYRRVEMIMGKAAGKATAIPPNPAPHWRNRPTSVLTPALDTLRARNFDLTREIMNAARREGKDLSWFLGDLVFEAMRARAIHADSDAA